MMWQGIDQRKFPRVNYKCRIKVAKPGEEEIVETHTENIGIGGICVVIDRKFELFETVTLQLMLNGDKSPIECEGTVCWVVGRHPVDEDEKMTYDVGIEFQDISDEDRSRVERVVGDILSG